MLGAVLVCASLAGSTEGLDAILKKNFELEISYSVELVPDAEPADERNPLLAGLKKHPVIGRPIVVSHRRFVGGEGADSDPMADLVSGGQTRLFHFNAPGSQLIQVWLHTHKIELTEKVRDVGGCLSRVLNPDVGFHFGPFGIFFVGSTIKVGQWLNGNVSPQLPLTIVHGDLVRLAGLAKRDPDEKDPNGSYNYSSDAYHEQSEGPGRHVLLGGKIILGAAMLVLGLYFYANAFDSRRDVSLEAGICYAIIGSLGILIGIFFCAQAAFGS